MSRNAARLVFWSPRVLTIAFAIFLSIFALDVFNEHLSAWHTVFALLVHLIPTAIIAAVLLVAWRWEWVGTVLFAAVAVLYAFKALPMHPSWALFISVPLLVIAGLFFTNWLKRSELRAAH